MEVSEFIEKMPAWVEAVLLEHGITDVILEETTVTKSNDTVRHGLLFKKDGTCICPTYYFEDFYEAFGEDGNLEEAAQAMVRSYLVTGAPMVPDGAIELDLNKLGDDLVFRILDVEINREYLEDVPYRTMCGSLVMVADLRLGGTGEWRTLVPNELLEESDYTEDWLFERAMENTTKNFPPMMTEIGQDIEGQAVNLLDQDEEGFLRDRVYVLTNSGRSLGAGVIFYPGVAERIASLTGGFTVIPSSIHETILIPDSLCIPVPVMQFMLEDANRNVVEEREILSGKLLHVDESGIISPVVMTEIQSETVSQAL